MRCLVDNCEINTKQLVEQVQDKAVEVELKLKQTQRDLRSDMKSSQQQIEDDQEKRTSDIIKKVMQQVDKKAVVCVDKFGIPIADDLMGKEKEKWTIRDYVVMSLKPKLESQLAEFQSLLDKQIANVNKDLQ